METPGPGLSSLPLHSVLVPRSAQALQRPAHAPCAGWWCCRAPDMFALLLFACLCMSATLHCAHVVAVFALSFTLSPCLSPLCVMDAPQRSVGAFRQFSDWELSELYDEFNQLTNRDLMRANNEVMQDRLVQPTPPESDNDGWESAQDDARPANETGLRSTRQIRLRLSGTTPVLPVCRRADSGADPGPLLRAGIAMSA